MNYKLNPEVRKMQKHEIEIPADELEHCVLCGEPTRYKKNEPISKRNYYVDGAGQLCRKCYLKLGTEEKI